MTYEWLTAHEAILHRPDMYVGPLLPPDGGFEMDLYFDSPRPTRLAFSPILPKLFDEVLTNALDAAVPDPEARTISVRCSETGLVTIENDGAGIPLELFPGCPTRRYIPDILFSEANAGSNFRDQGSRLCGGRNGVGVVCVNVWSTLFRVTIQDPTTEQTYSQEFRDNLRTRAPPVLGRLPRRARGLVRLEFLPDYARLLLGQALDVGLLRALLRTRLMELAAVARAGLDFALDDVPVQGSLTLLAEQFLHLEDASGDQCGALQQGPGLRLVVGRRTPETPASSVGWPTLAFVNGVRCGSGTHVRHVTQALHKALQDAARRSLRKPGFRLQATACRDRLGLVLSCTVPDPAFASQMKDALATPVRAFGWTYEPSARLLQKLSKLGIIDELIRASEDSALSSSLRRAAPSRNAEPHVPKYDPALRCQQESQACTLILCEGDSAKSFVTAGLGAVGRDHYGVYPLRGVPLNCRIHPLQRCLENAEVAALCKILGLAPGSTSTPRYGQLLIAADADEDGAHIAGLVVNMVQHLFPQVLAQKPDFLQQLRTPAARATHRVTGEEREFFTAPALQDFLEGPGASASWTVKHLKGLGTNTSQQAKALFRALASHIRPLRLTPETPALLATFFDGGQAHVLARKLLLQADALPPATEPEDTADAFLQRELAQYSRYSLGRALPNAVDGLTRSRRKVLYWALTKAPKTGSVKVAQAAAAVAQATHYAHGEQSLVETIVGLAQDFPGSNNVALLVPEGQFGTRLQGGKDHAAARYIWTALAPVTRALFPSADLPLLPPLVDEGHPVEPAFLVPVLPLLLLNGAQGIATGFATRVPPVSFADLLAAARIYAAWDGVTRPALPPLRPYVQGFRGELAPDLAKLSIRTRGVVALLPDEEASWLRVTELPVGLWTEQALLVWRAMVEQRTVLDGRQDGAAEAVPLTLVQVCNRSTESAVCVDLELSARPWTNDGAVAASLLQSLHLQSWLSWKHMHAFNALGTLRQYDTLEDLLHEHALARRSLYGARRAAQLETLAAEEQTHREHARFAAAVVAGVVQIVGRPRAEVHQALATVGFAEALLNLPTRTFTLEAVADLETQALAAQARREALERQSPGDLWLTDLAALEIAYADYLASWDERHGDGVDADGPQRRKKRRPRR